MPVRARRQARYALAAALLSAVAAPPVHALLLDFADIPPAATFAVGTSFNTGGVSVDVQEFIFGSGTGCLSIACGEAFVLPAAPNIGAGQVLLPNNTLLDFDLGTVDNLTLEWEDTGGNANLRINGDFRNVSDLLTLDGLTVGGVLVSVVNNGAPGDLFGTLTLSGAAIGDFAIGGQELFLDNLAVRESVPEPATLLLLGASLGLLGLRRRRG